MRNVKFLISFFSLVKDSSRWVGGGRKGGVTEEAGRKWRKGRYSYLQD